MQGWIRDAYAHADALDAARFAAYFREDGVLTFGNDAAVVGPAAIAAKLAVFFGTLRAMRHEMIGAWEAGSVTVLEAAVTYTRRLDDAAVTVRGVTVLRTDGARFADVRVYYDLAPLFATAAPPPTLEARCEAIVDESLEESFPASDPPAHRGDE